MIKRIIIASILLVTLMICPTVKHNCSYKEKHIWELNTELIEMGVHLVEFCLERETLGESLTATDNTSREKQMA